MFNQALIAAAAVASVSALNVTQSDEAMKKQLLQFAQTEVDAEATLGMNQTNQIHLAKHNEYRRRHGVPELEYDAQLAEQAYQWSVRLADLGRLQHSSRSERNNAGENLAWSSSSSQAQSDWATRAWYDEITDPGYDFNNPGYQSGTGHFTQVVWKNSERLGCGEYQNYVTCHYYPAGNITNHGYFEQNVLPPNDNSNGDDDDNNNNGGNTTDDGNNNNGGNTTDDDDNNNNGGNTTDDDDADQNTTCPAITFNNCAHEFYRVFAPLPQRRLITLNAYFCMMDEVVYFREAIDFCISLF